VIQNPVSAALEAVFKEVQHIRMGEVATYIPELGRANPDHFAVCLATVDGHLYHVGDYEIPFTIQSISKPFMFGLALEDHGLEQVLKKVKVEPSGEAFNSISLEPGTGKPLNPMINAGAIAIAAMVKGNDATERRERMLAMFGRFSGRPMTIDEPVFQSERETGHRNRAIAHLLRNADIIEEQVEESLDLYFEQCSVSVTCEDLAWLAATLANHGRNPRTGEVALQPDYVEHVLSVMVACGMYDYAGAWIFRVGMPAKSGVSGGIIAVLPGQFGIGVFSPALDHYGNSVRGIAVCEQLSKAFGLHLLKVNFSSGIVLRTRYSLAEVPSNRLWAEPLNHRLKELGKGVQIYELQGALVFGTAEVLFREVLSHLTGTQIVIFHFRRVQSLDEATAQLFASFIQDYATAGGIVLFAHLEPGNPLYHRLEQALTQSSHFRCFTNSDLAREWAEEYLLNQQGLLTNEEAECSIDNHPAFDTFSAEARTILAQTLIRYAYPPGAKIIRRGEPATALFFLMKGRVSINLELTGGQLYRLTTMSAGALFGVMAFIDGEPRSADVDSQTDAVCLVLPMEQIANLVQTIPDFYEKISNKVALDLASRLVKANSEILALES
jgi:glutaminase